MADGERLLEVLVHELGHVEHRDLGLAAEHRLQLLVGVDHAAVVLVLQIVLLDVVPELLRHLGARDRGGANHWCKRCRRGHGLHEGRVWRALRLLRWGLLLRGGPFACGLLRGGFLPSALLAGGLLLGSGHRLISWWVIETRSRAANTNPSRHKLKTLGLYAIGREGHFPYENRCFPL